MMLRRGPTTRDVPEESLMLTGDENIVDVDFAVLWKVKPDGLGEFLFNIQAPEGTVKAVAESAMREVIGRSNIQPILTGARQNIETAVHDLMQKVLDDYGAGVLIDQVQMQKVDPPSQVIDAFRDVQAARADLERAQNEAQTYANRVLPEARGRVAQITQNAEAYREQTVAEAKGQTSRFLQIYDEYKKAPEVTRQRLYLETMERLFSGTDKIILDSGTGGGSGGVVPFLPLNELTRPRPATPAAAAGAHGRHPMKLGYRRAAYRSSCSCSRPCVAYSALFAVPQTHQALVLRFGNPVRVISDPGLNYKVPFIDNVIYVDKRILDLENPAQEIIASDQKRLVVDAFARYKITDPLRYYQTLGSLAAANSQLGTLLNAGLRRVLGEATFTHVVRDDRSALMGRIREALDRDAARLRHRRRRRADPPRRSAGAEQPGGLSAHADRTPARGRGIPRARRAARAGNPLARGPRRHRPGRRRDLDAPNRSAARATASATGFSRMRSTATPISSRSIARCRLMKPA